MCISLLSQVSLAGHAPAPSTWIRWSSYCRYAHWFPFLVFSQLKSCMKLVTGPSKVINKKTISHALMCCCDFSLIGLETFLQPAVMLVLWFFGVLITMQWHCFMQFVYFFVFFEYCLFFTQTLTWCHFRGTCFLSRTDKNCFSWM